MNSLKIFIEQDLTKEKLKVAKVFILIFLYLIIAIPDLGEIFRGERTPWLWEFKSNFGTIDLLLNWISYLLCYSIGYFIPYSIINLTIWVLYFNGEMRKITKEISIAIKLISFAFLATFLIYLKGFIAFFHLLPDDGLMVLWLIIIFSFFGGGLRLLIMRLKNSENKP
jgi:hypothetical protein